MACDPNERVRGRKFPPNRAATAATDSGPPISRNVADAKSS